MTVFGRKLNNEKIIRMLNIYGKGKCNEGKFKLNHCYLNIYTSTYFYFYIPYVMEAFPNQPVK